ncbi:MAG: ABC transporter substrate-binding protein, partial [Helicobacter sp.]|nr:ABC transporter substrate-binding protein [Helicobacter sp.]
MRWLLFLLVFNLYLGAEVSNAFAINGEVKYKTLKYFDYVNPNAKKGGHVKRHSIGTYDSFYNFLLKGTSVEGLG